MHLGPNFKYGTMLMLVVFIVGVVGLYAGTTVTDSDHKAEAGAGADNGGPPGPPGGPVSVKLAAKNSLFDKRTIVASPGAPMTVDLDNQDAGVLHNIAFYTNRGAGTKIPNAATNPTAGPVVEEVKFSAPTAPGNYYFRCDVHPDTMNGTFSVR